MNIDFDWDPVKAASNARKHRILFEDAMAIFADPFARSLLDEGPNISEERWVTIGQGRSGALIVVVHTYMDLDDDRAIVRIISARRATRREGRQYRESDVS